MKRTLSILLLLALTTAGTYLTTIWHYKVGLFAENTVRDGKLQGSAGLEWARPMSLEGLPNLHKVCDDLYRGAQPTGEGFASLQKLGVKTIINFREHDDDSAVAARYGLTVRNIPLTALVRPTDQEVAEFLKIVGDRKNLPAFVHCMHGADRTGMMCAIYRVAVQGWGKQAAVDEMTRGGFGYHKSFENLVEYVQTSDFARLLREAGATTKP